LHPAQHLIDHLRDSLKRIFLVSLKSLHNLLDFRFSCRRFLLGCVLQERVSATIVPDQIVLGPVSGDLLVEVGLVESLVRPGEYGHLPARVVDVVVAVDIVAGILQQVRHSVTDDGVPGPTHVNRASRVRTSVLDDDRRISRRPRAVLGALCSLERLVEI
jgi:hypothetical protein